MEERAELEAVLSSGIFARAPSLAQVLIYVCRKYFDGNVSHIKEYNIAVEALGRPPDFDQKSDAIVRVEAHRLRKRLKQYYEGPGASHAIRITLEPGSYVPHFVGGADPGARLEPSAIVPMPAPISPPAVSIPLRRRPGWTAAFALLLPLAAVLLFYGTRAPHSARSDGLFIDGNEIRILAGAPLGRYVDRLGHAWLGDRFFEGGTAVENPAHVVERTPDPALYHSRREGEFSYHIPLKPGEYELRLYFAETVFGAGKPQGGGETSRLFSISINGQPLLSTFDIISDAGGPDAADMKVFKDVSPAADGALHLRFKSEGAPALLNAIEILPAAAGRIRPIRILAQEGMYVDKQGRVWSGDRFFHGGNTVVRSEAVRNVTEPAILHGERYGNFTYTIPVAKGRYSITLHFAETWFGPGKRAGGGVDSRVFDVYCNGVALLKNFDIYKTAGGSDVAVDRTFSGLAPNAQDKFVLSFVPVRNYACINAIEVLDETK